MSIKQIINWKLFFILLAACIAAAMMVIPYSLALTSNEIKMTPVILYATVGQNLFLFALTIFLGLFLSKRAGMGAPILQGFLEGENQTKKLKSVLTPSVIWGLAAGIIIILLSIPFNKLIPELGAAEISIPAWKALLASFYGGIAEEVLLRLFMVSLIVWITFIIKKNKDGRPTVFGIWLAIVLAAVIFGLGHLPATSQITELTGLVIIRAVVLNGAGGIIFGWLYCKNGLESAMIAHFCADIVLHIVTPAAVRLFG